MNWISVKERLPEEYSTVFMYNISDEVLFGYYEDGNFLNDEYIEGMKAITSEVTHWIYTKDVPKPKDKS